MIQSTIHAKSTTQVIRDAIAEVPGAAELGSLGIQEALQACGMSVLWHIRQAFIVKSTGGTDEAGLRWAPLAASTLAARKRKYGARRKQKRDSKGRFTSEESPAARRMRLIIRSRGRIPVHDRRPGSYDILRDSGALLDSLSPGSDSPHQVFTVDRGRVTFGTTRPGAATHPHGSPSRGIPQRRLWPDPKEWPESWWRDIRAHIVQALVDLVAQKVRDAR